jgi:hypothetical protein
MMPPGLPDRVLVDTTVLRDLAFAEVLPECQRDCLRTEHDLAAMLAFLRACARRATIPQVFTELNRHLMRELRAPKLLTARAQWFGSWLPFFSEAQTPPLAKVGLELVAAVGPTDACLFDVARCDNLSLLTADTELYGRAKKLKVPTLSAWAVTTNRAFRS